jgi:hypothetical protein
MRERGIIMQPWEVRAYLEGRKTRFTRPVKPQPKKYCVDVDRVTGRECYEWRQRNMLWEPTLAHSYCPWQPGDLLWVRETWALAEDSEGQLIDSQGHGQCHSQEAKRHYKATLPEIMHGAVRWRSPVTMPRWASRLWLRVKDVRVGRVRDTAPSECFREGFRFDGRQDAGEWISRQFSEQWDEDHAKRGLGWDANPWVWITTTERVEAPR